MVGGDGGVKGVKGRGVCVCNHDQGEQKVQGAGLPAGAERVVVMEG